MFSHSASHTATSIFSSVYSDVQYTEILEKICCHSEERFRNEEFETVHKISVQLIKIDFTIQQNWKRYVKFKRAYHLAVTQLYQGLAAEEQQKMGERVAFYNAALAALNDARSMYTSAKGTMGIAGEKEAIEEALTFTNDVIEGKRKAAKNENEFIYHEEVPEKDVLPTINGASLVKGIPFSVNDPEVSGPDIFARYSINNNNTFLFSVTLTLLKINRIRRRCFADSELFHFVTVLQI